MIIAILLYDYCIAASKLTRAVLSFGEVRSETLLTLISTGNTRLAVRIASLGTS